MIAFIERKIILVLLILILVALNDTLVIPTRPKETIPKKTYRQLKGVYRGVSDVAEVLFKTKEKAKRLVIPKLNLPKQIVKQIEYVLVMSDSSEADVKRVLEKVEAHKKSVYGSGEGINE